MGMGRGLLLTLLPLLFTLTLAATDNPDNSDILDYKACNIDHHGIEMEEVGEVHDAVGEATILSVVDLSEADTSFLFHKAYRPRFCNGEEETSAMIMGLCKEMHENLKKTSDFLEVDKMGASGPSSGTANATDSRPKRQIGIIAGLTVSALIGFFGNNFFPHEDQKKLKLAIRQLADKSGHLDTEVTQLGDDVYAMMRLELENTATLKDITEDLSNMEKTASALQNQTSLFYRDELHLTQLLIHWTHMKRLKAMVELRSREASLRYQGIISGLRHRLLPSLVSPARFHAELSRVQGLLQEKSGLRLSFGSPEAAYAATRVTGSKLVYYPVYHQASKRHFFRRAVAVVWKTPYFSAPKTARLYKLRSYPLMTADVGDGLSHLQVQLNAPYIAIREDPKTRTDAHGYVPGEYYQLLHHHDIRDTGNRTFINMKPSAFMHSSEHPSCEYDAVRGTHDGQENCLRNTKIVEGKKMVTLGSGCWLVGGNETTLQEEECPDGSHRRVIPALRSPTGFLFKPRCGCKYVMGAMTVDLPATAVNCNITTSMSLPYHRIPDSRFLNLLNATYTTFNQEMRDLGLEFDAVKKTFVDKDRLLKSAISIVQEPYVAYEKMSAGQKAVRALVEEGKNEGWMTVLICIAGIVVGLLVLQIILCILSRRMTAAASRRSKTIWKKHNSRKLAMPASLTSSTTTLNSN